jgi:signal peptidase I
LAQAQPSNIMLFVDGLARAPLSRVLIFAACWTVVRLVVLAPLLRTAKHKRGAGWKLISFINEFADAMVYAAVIVFMLVRPFGIQTFWIPSASMYKTLHTNDMIVANKFIYRMSDPKRNDIVVFRPPARALNPGDAAADFIKRLIGAPGDVIELKDKVLHVNGKKVAEPFVDFTDPFNDSLIIPRDRWEEVPIEDFKLVKDGDRYIPLTWQGGMVNLKSAREYGVESQEEADRLMALPPAAVPEGMYLFMGDHRNKSYDSRYWGLVPRESIIGRSEFVWMPLSRIGATR